ncbi:hypothetical protein L1987_63035 [Smallanthus sonchifolius]|uniref:Uncharacterized protein n=1 Tax=Smallanthus sonchifolius TaxID=185202 RepID=A0ACB9CC64_9ASTR|nr:hypothetical protein L1987_63035 [Smallanthus sonchifolius]
MAASRAVWQRAANRYFIQEDAKRAPKLTSVISKVDTKPVNGTDLDEESFYLNSSDSKWWLQLQPDYMYQRGLEFQKSHQFVENQDNSSISSINSVDSRSSKGSFEFVDDSVELPWWKVGETDDSGSFGSKKLCNLSESYVLDQPVHAGLEPQEMKCGQSACKTKILEALCHSQTRAREAEFAAKKAYAEKEHAIKVVFRQASQLFAYRQWIYVLQLENLCYQIKNKKSDPMVFSRSNIGKLDENLKNVGPEKGKRTRIRRGFGRYDHDLGGYVVVFVVGLGIVGAGLLLGWTVGWMLI